MQKPNKFQMQNQQIKASAGLIQECSECKKKLKMKNAAHLMQPRCKSTEFMNIFQTVYKSKILNHKNENHKRIKLVERECEKRGNCGSGSCWAQGSATTTVLTVQENTENEKFKENCKDNVM